MCAVGLSLRTGAHFGDTLHTRKASRWGWPWRAPRRGESAVERHDGGSTRSFCCSRSGRRADRYRLGAARYRRWHGHGADFPPRVWNERHREYGDLAVCHHPDVHFGRDFAREGQDLHSRTRHCRGPRRCVSVACGGVACAAFPRLARDARRGAHHRLFGHQHVQEGL